MKVFQTIVELQNQLFADRKAGKTIGLVPTMGALHQGHASLVKRSVSENDATVVSVFVNPTQFNDKNDLKNYPRTLEADCKLLESRWCRHTFLHPQSRRCTPSQTLVHFSYPPVDHRHGGSTPPWTLQRCLSGGEPTVLHRTPDRAYFGEKDFQQIAVIRAMVRPEHEGADCGICPCPIVREADGLALSSRNTLLTAEERKIAVNPHLQSPQREPRLRQDAHAA